MLTHTFDIFSGKYREHGAFWFQAVAGFEEAYQMMLTLAVVKPGPYFIFDSPRLAVVLITMLFAPSTRT